MLAAVVVPQLVCDHLQLIDRLTVAVHAREGGSDARAVPAASGCTLLCAGVYYMTRLICVYLSLGQSLSLLQSRSYAAAGAHFLVLTIVSQMIAVGLTAWSPLLQRGLSSEARLRGQQVACGSRQLQMLQAELAGA